MPEKVFPWWGVASESGKDGLYSVTEKVYPCSVVEKAEALAYL